MGDESTSRVSRIVLVAALVLAVAVCLDVLTSKFTFEGIREGDWFVFAPAAAFIACAVWRRPLARKLSIGLLAGTFSLLTIESLLSLATYDANRPQPWYVWPPNRQYRVSPENLVGVAPTGKLTINSLGMRGEEPPQDADYRILCIGGSTTECMYLDDRKAWPQLLAERLCGEGDSSQRQKVWVGNLGRSGLMTTDHLILLEHLPEVDHADCWVVLCGVNDMGLFLQGEYDKLARDPFARAFAWRRPGFSGRWDRPLFRNTYTYAMVSGAARHAKLLIRSRGREAIQDMRATWVADRCRLRQAEPKSDHLPDLTEPLNRYEQNLRRIVEISRTKGKRLILMTQPTLWYENLPAELENLLTSGVRPDGTCLSAGALARGMDAYNERLRTVCHDEGIECVDLAALLPRSTATFFDDCHFNEGGAAQVAEHLASAIQASTPVLAKAARREATR